jgi:hypothetical protein
MPAAACWSSIAQVTALPPIVNPLEQTPAAAYHVREALGAAAASFARALRAFPAASPSSLLESAAAAVAEAANAIEEAGLIE